MNRPSRTIVCVLVVAALATPLFAHMKLEKSEPAANSTVTAVPKQLQIWFTESPDVKVSKLTLTGPGGAIKLGEPKATGKSMTVPIQGDVADGVYTAAWQSAGDDGHVQKGEFKFTVKRSK